MDTPAAVWMALNIAMRRQKGWLKPEYTEPRGLAWFRRHCGRRMFKFVGYLGETIYTGPIPLCDLFVCAVCHHVELPPKVPMALVAY